MLHTYPGSGSGIQLVFCVKIIKLVLHHITVIMTDAFQYSLFHPQYRIWGSMIIQLLDAFVNGALQRVC